jgi:hypothetical protein
MAPLPIQYAPPLTPPGIPGGGLVNRFVMMKRNEARCVWATWSCATCEFLGKCWVLFLGHSACDLAGNSSAHLIREFCRAAFAPHYWDCCCRGRGTQSFGTRPFADFDSLARVGADRRRLGTKFRSFDDACHRAFSRRASGLGGRVSIGGLGVRSACVSLP